MSKLKILYRKARIEDVSDIKLIESVCGLSPWSTEDYLEEVDKNPNFIICELEKKTIGFILVRLITLNIYLAEKNISVFNKIEEKTAEAEILNIGVLEKYRRNGIGAGLVEFILGKMQRYDKYSIILDVRTSNNSAINFYKSFDFKIISKRKNFYSNPLEDGFFMKLEKI